MDIGTVFGYAGGRFRDYQGRADGRRRIRREKQK
jgi:hypothetical protein